MPPHIKGGLSFATALVGLVAIYWFYNESRLAMVWAVAFLIPTTIVAMWIFPEVERKPGGKQQRDSRPI